MNIKKDLPNAGREKISTCSQQNAGANGQRTATPESQGIPTRALISLVRRLEEHKIPMHSLVVARHGCLVGEAYYAPYTKKTLHRMFSETKSYTSLAIGLLVSDGKISLQDKICNYFTEYLPGKVHPWMAEMTVENLLMMETCHNMTTYNKTSTTENWVRSFFQTVPTHRPGTVFMYDTSASHTLCALVEKLTGQKLLDFLKGRFLREIGFSEESYVIPDPFGVSMGGTGLMALPGDMLRVGFMLMSGGNHPDDYGKEEARRVYPGEYLEKALSFQTPTAMNSSTDTGYGYQFWKLPYDGFAMLGMGSQDLLCFPQQDMVFVVNSDTQGIPNGSDIILNDIAAEVFEALSDQPLAEDEAAQREWKEITGKLTLPILENRIEGEKIQAVINGHDYYFCANPNGFKRMKVLFENGERGCLEYENERGTHRIPFGLGTLEECIFPEYEQKCVTSAGWCAPDTLYIRTWLVDECVASIHFKMVFSDDGELTVLMKKTEETKFNEFQGFLT